MHKTVSVLVAAVSHHACCGNSGQFRKHWSYRHMRTVCEPDSATSSWQEIPFEAKLAFSSSAVNVSAGRRPSGSASTASARPTHDTTDVTNQIRSSRPLQPHFPQLAKDTVRDGVNQLTNRHRNFRAAGQGHRICSGQCNHISI